MRLRFRPLITATLAGLAIQPFCHADEAAQVTEKAKGKLILIDDFERSESKPELEEVGGGWSTNSRSRAKGVKQVDLIGGAIFIKRADVADHGVSVVHDLEFQNAHIALRFKIGKADTLGINIADMKEKSVHAGHICVATIRPKQIEIADLKTGRMELQRRERRKAGKQTDADKEQIAKTASRKKIDCAPDVWHTLDVEIKGQTMSVRIDGKPVNEFTSPGIGHPTKRRLRLAVARQAWVDDVKVWRLK
ncbi:MAG: DUF1080 domain-containing protein [Aureliella sp.]